MQLSVSAFLVPEQSATSDLHDAILELGLAPWASRRRKELLELLDRLNPSIGELTAAVAQEAHKRPEALRLMTHPDVGPITALAYVLISSEPRSGFLVGSRSARTPEWFRVRTPVPASNAWGTSANRAAPYCANLLVEAAQAAARINPHWRRRYIHLAMRRRKSIAKVAMGRRMAIRLHWMWRNGCDYSPSLEFGSHAAQLEKRQGGN